MTEHSIEELERQYQQARNKAEEALKASSAAKARLDQARVEATGLYNHVVSYTKTSWKNSVGTEVRFVVRELSWGASVRGPIVKKDGYLGERHGDARISELTDHGPYVVPQE